MPAFDTTTKTKKGWTIFHVAAENSDPQVAKLILNKFKFEDTRDDFGWTIIHRAVAYGQKETIALLIDSRHKIGINIEAQTNKDSTILHFACQYRHIEIVDLVQKALEEINSPIDFDTRNQSQKTPLFPKIRYIVSFNRTVNLHFKFYHTLTSRPHKHLVF